MTRSSSTLSDLPYDAPDSGVGDRSDHSSSNWKDSMSLESLSTSTERLAELLAQQSSLYDQLESLCDDQHRQITSGNVQDLLHVLSQRQQVIDQLTGLEKQLGPYRQDWSGLWERLAPAQRTTLAADLQHTQQALSRIIEKDEQARHLLEKTRGQLHQELTKISQGGAAMRAYKTQNSAENRFTNQQG